MISFCQQINMKTKKSFYKTNSTTLYEYSWLGYDIQLQIILNQGPLRDLHLKYLWRDYFYLIFCSSSCPFCNNTLRLIECAKLPLITILTMLTADSMKLYCHVCRATKLWANCQWFEWQNQHKNSKTLYKFHAFGRQRTPYMYEKKIIPTVWTTNSAMLSSKQPFEFPWLPLSREQWVWWHYPE